MRDTLTTPHNNPNNPFAFTPDQLAALHDPKNIELLHTYGGLKGVARGLHTNIHSGLVPNTVLDKNIHLSSITSDVELYGPFAKRVEIFGANVLPPAKVKNIFQLMWMAFKDKTLILLAIAAVVSLAVGLYDDIAQPEYDANGNKMAGVKWVEGVAIIVAIVIVVLVGSVNDFQKERQFQKLNAKKEDRLVKATRDSTTSLISVHDIQVGDLLHLEPGDIVAADGIFIEGHNVRCDESAATGESDAVHKQTFEACYKLYSQKEEDSKAQSLSADSRSLPDPFIISGSKVVEGVCTYLVTGVGVNSYYGRTMMALRTDNQTTPLQEKLNGLASMIAKLGSAAGLLMLIVLLIRYFVSWRYGIPTEATVIVRQIMDILIVVVTIVVVAVPEGLPLAVTLALAYATQRMLKDNNLVRVLAACETMGNATTICSDKTGTLTQNKMTVVTGTLGTSFRFMHEAPTDRDDIHDMSTVSEKVPKPILSLLHQGIAINTTAFEGADENGTPCFIGNKTETALLALSKNLGAEDYNTLRSRWKVEQVLPFSSERKAMATIIKIPHPTDPARFIYRAHVKGASELLVEECNTIITLNTEKYKSQTDADDVQIRSLTTGDLDRIGRIIQSYATRSLRTIGIAYRDFDSWPPYATNKATGSNNEEEDGEEIEISYEDIIDGKGLTLLGIVGIEDPLRPGVKEAVKTCQQAGVFVRMVTGDNVVTAKSIAKQCGIYTTGGIVMEGPVFRNLPSHEMDAILPRLQVLARSSPEDKQILVGRLKELGDIVAVTGDGTNDGPALKLADVGFSMGIAGTEVAKEASSIILMDDNFSSIVRAIMWGRCVNDAVKKFLEFQLTVNVTAVILTFISSVASSEQKSVLTAVQLLWVNLIMDTFAALALATDPPTEELLQRGPEPRSSPLITFKMWKMIIGQAIFQIVVTIVLLYSDILHYEPNDPILQTIVFNTFVFCQIFNEINCRRIDSHLNVFHNILSNQFFIFIFFLCVALQAIIVNFGGAAFQVTKIDGVAWAISIGIGLLALPIGVIIRLIPDNALSFVFFFNPEARKRYLGGGQDDGALPTIYMAGSERIAWNNNDVQKGMSKEGQPGEKKSSRKSSIAASVVLPTMIATAWIPQYQESDPNYEERRQSSVLSTGSLIY
ncbi:PMCA-type calcium-translocating P-type ATPase [Backusella circina FSU 941]|nr:PMCA-type calcium-translocating P-type ATPase [Backusella circina FSU 941]